MILASRGSKDLANPLQGGNPGTTPQKLCINEESDIKIFLLFQGTGTTEKGLHIRLAHKDPFSSNNNIVRDIAAVGLIME